MKINIAIDGYSSCGKSTLAKELAKQLQYTYIDSGAMYRAITLYFLRANILATDIEGITNGLQNIKLYFETDANDMNCIFLNDENVALNIRDLIIADKVSDFAAVKEIREFAVEMQQQMGKRKGIVMDGRDIGTVVFPDAELKIFMTAAPEVRVKRRFQEMHATNPNITIEEVRANIEMRDYIDSNRKESPLTKAEDARVLDNSDLSKSEQLKISLQWAKEVMQLTS